MTVPLDFLILPGLGNSGAGHWQSLWQAELPRTSRVDLGSWDRPAASQWIERAAAAVAANPGAVLIAHSLGAILATLVAGARPDLDIGGALLVAPADVESGLHTPDFLRGFAPIPERPLPFPTVVVASRNDPYMRFSRAGALAAAWRAELVDAGAAGHINAASGHGHWPEGRALLARFADRPRRALDARAGA